MATQSWIMAQENAVIQHTNTLKALRESFNYECESNINYLIQNGFPERDTKLPHRENENYWATLLLNLQEQKRQLDITIEMLNSKPLRL